MGLMWPIYIINFVDKTDQPCLGFLGLKPCCPVSTRNEKEIIRVGSQFDFKLFQTFHSFLKWNLLNNQEILLVLHDSNW